MSVVLPERLPGIVEEFVSSPADRLIVNYLYRVTGSFRGAIGHGKQTGMTSHWVKANMKSRYETRVILIGL